MILRIIWAVVVVSFLAVQPVHAKSTPRPPIVTAKAAILVDRKTGEVLWQNNPDVPLPPASTTKIVTAMLALQSGRLDESFPVSDEASQEPPSKISLHSGWRVRLRDLVYALLMNSANDAAVVIAEGLADNVRTFAARMNVHAYALGATNTHFVNPNGLPADDHYTTARDLATMFSHGMDDPRFREVLTTTALSILPTEGSRRPISLHTKNRLLTYPVQVIGKTGWTRAAGKCFVGAGRADGREVLVAVLGSGDLWGDLRRLIDFGFGRGPEPLPRQDPQLQIAAAAPQKVAPAASKRRAPSVQGDSDDDIRYSIRLASFRSHAQAHDLKARVRKQGYPAQVSIVDRGKKTSYLVSVGTYNDRAAAARAARLIQKRHPSLRPSIVGS